MSTGDEHNCICPTGSAFPAATTETSITHPLKTGLTVSACVLLMASGALAASVHEPLVEVLIRKGILTEQEAQQIEKEAEILQEQRQQEQKEQLVKEMQQKSEPKALQGLKFRMLSYLDYSIGNTPEPDDGQSSYNKFAIKRGYLRVDKTITPWLGAHLTYDIHQDGDGDWMARMKYLFAQFKPSDLGFVTNMKSEVGMGHIPWLDFEEHINPYRCQGTMAIERAGTFNSADLGLSIRGNFGGRLENAATLLGNHHYDGRWGSWHLGVYNGSGYHAKEDNQNKVIEGRLTLRPLPDNLPGLQISGFGLTGEGNERTEYGDYTDYQAYIAMLSYQHPRFIFTTQYITTQGNKDGSWYDDTGDALWTQGGSLFANYKPPLGSFLPALDKKFNLFFRYDWMDRDKDNKIAADATYNMYIIGGAWEVFVGNYILMDYEWTTYGRDFGAKKSSMPVPGRNNGDENKFQMVYQLKF